MTTPLDPLLAPRGAGEGYHQKSRVMLILGFSIVVNQKIIFILGYLQPSQGHHPGGGAVVEEFRGGGWVLYYQISCVMLILGFSLVWNPKFIFILGYPHPHKGARGDAGGLEGTLECGLVCCYNKTDVIFESISIEILIIDIPHFWFPNYWRPQNRHYKWLGGIPALVPPQPLPPPPPGAPLWWLRVP